MSACHHSGSPFWVWVQEAEPHEPSPELPSTARPPSVEPHPLEDWAVDWPRAEFGGGGASVIWPLASNSQMVM